MLAWRARHRTEREVERHVAERERRRARAQRLAVLGLAALVAVVGITVFALVEQGNANEQSREAEARRLDAEAVALLPEDPELSLLLAAHSARLAPAEPAEDALLQSLLTLVSGVST